MMRAWVLVTILALCGCGAHARHARAQVDRARRAEAQKLDAARHAPAAFARYEAALRAAKESPADSSEQSTRALEARLWLETAIAESEQRELSRRRLAEEQALIALDTRALEIGRADSAHGRDDQLHAAQALARAEVDKALARAARRPAQRVKLSREDAQAAAEALTQRARLVALTVASMLPESAGLGRVRAQLAQAEALLARDPDASLALADQALFHGLALLSELRREGPAPSAEEREALSEALRGSGLSVTRDERGLAATLEAAFAGATLSAGAARTLARMCQLAGAHPHGQLTIAVQSARGALAEARTQRVRQQLAQQGCRGQRFVIAADARPGDAIDAHWLAY